MLLTEFDENFVNAIIALNMNNFTIQNWTLNYDKMDDTNWLSWTIVENPPATREVTQYEFNMKLKVLYMSTSKDNSIIQLIAVDESNQMRRIKLSLSEGFLLVEKNIVSKPLNYFSFDSAISGTA